MPCHDVCRKTMQDFAGVRALGRGQPGFATIKLLQDIAEAFQPVGAKDPRLDVVPLLPFASWSEGSSAQSYN